MSTKANSAIALLLFEMTQNVEALLQFQIAPIFSLPLRSAAKSPAGRGGGKGRNRPRSLPDGTHLITIPIVELESLVDGGEKDKNSALYQKVKKKSKKEWILNPRNKTAVCILHEYLQVKMTPN